MRERERESCWNKTILDISGYFIISFFIHFDYKHDLEMEVTFNNLSDAPQEVSLYYSHELLIFL